MGTIYASSLKPAAKLCASFSVLKIHFSVINKLRQR